MKSIKAIRQLLENNQAVFTLVAMAMIGGSVYTLQNFMDRHATGRKRVTALWYYDINTGDLFAGPRNLMAPIDAPSGATEDGKPAGAQAHVFACGNCEKSNPFIGYLSRYTEDAKEAIQELMHDQIDNDYMFDLEMRVRDGFELRAHDGDQWYTDQSDGGQAIMLSLRDRCDGERLKACYPDPDVLLNATLR